MLFISEFLTCLSSESPKSFLVIALGGLYPLAFASTAQRSFAQVIPDRTLPQNSLVTDTLVTGGTKSGTNLFHSFQDFSVKGSILFVPDPDIRNIITRVTGNQRSRIDGILAVNGRANFFLINPNGITFGQNAQLGINGSLSQHASRNYPLQWETLVATHLPMAEIGERDRFERKTIMSDQRRGSHTVTRLTVHLVWVTKYRYPVLKGEIQKRCRELIIQICDAEDVKILKGVVSKDHVHMHIEYPPSKSISDLVRRIKGRTSRLLQQEYPELEKRYWGKHFWAIGYGAWSTGNLTEELVQEYLEHHRNPSNQDNDNFLLE